MKALGVDIGGSGIKGAVVDTEIGELVTERHRLPTPVPASPEGISQILGMLVKHFDWKGPVGCGFPAAVPGNIVRTASNIDSTWIGLNAAERFSEATGCPVRVINDADAAGLAEVRFGAGRDCQGTILVITIGTGLGSALFTHGQLVPNTELGHLMVRGKIAELYASDAVRKKEDLTWKKWAKRFDRVLHRYEELFWPDLIILGGGASKKFDKYARYFTVETEVVPAKLLNHAGIIGAALVCEHS